MICPEIFERVDYDEISSCRVLQLKVFIIFERNLKIKINHKIIKSKMRRMNAVILFHWK